MLDLYNLSLRGDLDLLVLNNFCNRKTGSDPDMKRFRNRVLMADSALVMIALFWGFGFIAMKDGLDSFPIFWLTALRFGSASVVMMALFWNKLKDLNYKEVKAGIIIGLFLFMGFVTQTMALKYTTVGKVAFLTTVYVVLVPFCSWILYRRSPGITAFISAFLCLGGMGLLSLDSSLSSGIGENLTLLCAIFFAIHLMSIEYFVKEMDPVKIASIQVIVVAVCSLAAALFLEQWPSRITSSSLWSIGFASLFCTVFAFVIQSTAQKFTPSTHTAIILSLESVFGAIFGIILLGDPLNFKIAIGFLLILIAVLITELMPYLKKNRARSKTCSSTTILKQE